MTTRKTDDDKTAKPATELRDEDLEPVQGGATRRTTTNSYGWGAFILPYIEQDN